MSAAKAALIHRIEALSEEEFDRIAPYIEADLDSASELDELRTAVQAGRQSAQSEPLATDERVRADARALLSPKR
jgi:hypothetical protein